MFKSLKKSFTKSSSNQIHDILQKIFTNNDTTPPKEKYIRLLLEELRSSNAFLAFTSINDLFLTISLSQWIPSLKLCYTIHRILNNNCINLAKGLNSNSTIQDIKIKQKHFQTQDLKVYVHSTICLNYLTYLERLSLNIEQSNLKNDLHLISLITKMHRELDISLKKYDNQKIVEEIMRILIKDMVKQYRKVEEQILIIVDNLLYMDLNMAKEDYGNYQEFLRLGRSVKKMCELDCDQSIELYQVDKKQNQRLEQHMNNTQQSRFRSIKNKNNCCIRTGSVGEEFIFLKKEIFMKQKKEDAIIEPDFNYVHKMCQIQTVESDKNINKSNTSKVLNFNNLF